MALAVTPKPVTGIAMDEAMLTWFGNLSRHYQNEEAVLCLYGVQDQAGRAIPVFARPPKVVSSSFVRVRFYPCGSPNPIHYGLLRYLGMFHTHPEVEGAICSPSREDIDAFQQDSAAVVEVVQCHNDISAMVKKPIPSSELPAFPRER
jgi:hypothetical protein